MEDASNTDFFMLAMFRRIDVCRLLPLSMSSTSHVMGSADEMRANE